MKTLAVISHKGGAGKTSSAVMLAEDFATRGLRVVLVDADRQRGAGLLLGIEQPTQSVMQTQNPRLRYFCCSGIPLRELPTKAQELDGLFDVAVVDTPSLDDPLARAWMQLSNAALMLIPIEPVSLKTLEAADAALDSAKRLNPNIQLLGTLATMFDESDTQHRTLILELRSRRSDDLFPEPVPMDLGLAHRAAQKAEQRTEPAAATRRAYRASGDFILQSMGLGKLCSGESLRTPATFTPRRAAAPAGQPAPANPAPVVPSKEAPTSRGVSPLSWAVAVFVIALILLGIGLAMRNNRASHSARPGTAGSLALRVSHAPRLAAL
jgi:chromosome partitioning protein